MKPLKIAIDTNVLVSALRSRRGASYRLLKLIDSPKIEVHISVPLFLEYEDAAKRLVRRGGLGSTDVDAILDYVAHISKHQQIFFLWRPALKDPKDDMVLELAVAAGCNAIVTYNKKDFVGVERFGIRLLDPRQLLAEIGELS